MSTPPPEITKEPKPAPTKSFYHQAASYSVIVPVVAFAMNVFMTVGISEMEPATKATAGFVVSCLAGLLILSGFAAGIVALFGIKQHGTKGILVKSIFGILIPAALIAMAIPAFLAVRAKAHEKAQQQQAR